MLTHPFQQSKDVEEKLGDLIPWLAKLKDSVAVTGADGNHEEAERRGRLTRFVSCLYCLADSIQSSVDPWKTLRNDLRNCWGKEKRLGFSIKLKILEQSSSWSKNFGKRSSSTRLAHLRSADRYWIKLTCLW